jgi:ADP-heptose:LPS heptosyltransferase
MEINFVSIFGKGNKGNFENIKPVTGEKNMTWIGIAPFAKHQGKIYPLEKTEEIVSYLAFRENCRLFFFGGGNEEQKILSEWEIKYPRSFSIIGKITGFEQELTLMSHLDVMVSMDSANMHLASLVGTPVISVWGATHPYAGFYGWNQLPENIVQSDLYCRPCSIYGNIPCYRNDYACLVKLPVKAIIDVIEKYLK